MSKLLITGSKDIKLKYPLSITDFISFFDILKPEEIISGGERGIDLYGEDFALNRYLTVNKIKADTYAFGKLAYNQRNKKMAKACDKALISWTGDDLIVEDLIEQLTSLNKLFFEVILKVHNE
jgi:hypothetical protein